MAEQQPLSTNSESSLSPQHQQLKSELEKSFLLEDQDRGLWLRDLPKLPLPIVDDLLREIVPRNQQYNEYIDLALSQDENQEELKQLKLETKVIIQKAYQIEEKVEAQKENGEEIELQNLEINDKIWIMNENKELCLESVKVKEYFGEDETYDMEMKEPFRNYISQNIVVHNTGGQNVKRWIQGSGMRMGGI